MARRTRRFYRPPPPLSNLARIVWSQKHGGAVAEFGREDNQFVTDKEDIAEFLISLGYIEVQMDAQAPPYIPEPTPKEIGDIKPIPAGFTEDHEVRKIKREAMLKEITPPVPKKVKPAEPVVSKVPAPPKPKPVAAPPKESKRKVIRRRVKK